MVLQRLQVLSFFLLMMSTHWAHAQVYSDYLGNGHTIGIKVSSSSGSAQDTAASTISGSNITPDLIGASRFLSQATLGVNYEEIERVSQIGINTWIDEQIALPYTSYYDTYREIYDTVMVKYKNIYPEGDSSRRRDYLNYTFYEKIFKEPNALRHRMAFTLSQILVLSINDGNFTSRGFAASSYYDILYGGAFGNFGDMLQEITLHPAMGIYLSHMKNEKADPIEGTLPDENYAREIMQLFTIGLYELNNDGTLKKDGAGNITPTYDIEDVQELSKVFTGLSGSAWDTILAPQRLLGTALRFNRGFSNYDLRQPMAMYEEYHDTTAKTMIDGTVLPSGRPGMQDITDAVDILFNHANVGPFISKRLIQHMIKSNPTPAYVNRIATVFNDNGKGERGDLESVMRAILLDPEAIECNWLEDMTGGKLIQPIERFMNLFKAFDLDSPSGKLWFRDFNELFSRLEQSTFSSPSVFNFFSPFYAEEKNVAPNDLVSPEFQILHATSSIHYLNLIENAIKRRPFINRTAINPSVARLTGNDDDEPFLDFSTEITLYESEGIMAVLDRLDILLCRGQLTSEIKTIIANAITAIANNYNTNSNNNDDYTSEEAVEDAIYFVMATPNYMISK